MIAKPRLAIDMDEVLADAVSAQREWYRKNFRYDWTDEDLVGKHFSDLVHKNHEKAMQAHLHEGQFFATLNVMPGATKAVECLSKEYEIFITTAAMEYPASCTSKFQWLKQHFPAISPLNIVFCGHKYILNSDFLLDDNARHFEKFSGQGVLFSAPHNRNVAYSPRVENWEDATSYFLSQKQT